MSPGVPPDCDQGISKSDPGKGWGYLTVHGQAVVEGLGAYYGKYYKRGAWKNGFNVYLWADGANQRTRATANALAAGLKIAGLPENKVTVDSLPGCANDPLFHPFKGHCGKPTGDALPNFATDLNNNWKTWAENTYPSEFRQLYDVLNCFDTTQCSLPLSQDTPKANACLAFTADCTAPIQWKEMYSYASSATEGFLLEYANKMDVAWKRVDPTKDAKLQSMLKLHEFYFDKTDRFLGDNKQANPELAGIEGSNLIREILDQLNRKATGRTTTRCPRAEAQSDFVGLVGHDTNLAGVGALLGLEWQFDDKNLPADTIGLPANDALPAGALVFELRQRTDGTYVVRVEYVTQSLDQMRNGPKAEAFRLAVDGMACGQKRPCEIPLEKFQQLVQKRIGAKFLSDCAGNEQTCGPAL
jgi:hypothetical protein